MLTSQSQLGIIRNHKPWERNVQLQMWPIPVSPRFCSLIINIYDFFSEVEIARVSSFRGRTLEDVKGKIHNFTVPINLYSKIFYQNWRF